MTKYLKATHKKGSILYEQDNLPRRQSVKEIAYKYILKSWLHNATLTVPEGTYLLCYLGSPAVKLYAVILPQDYHILRLSSSL
jgi:hypothetical protein